MSEEVRDTAELPKDRFDRIAELHSITRAEAIERENARKAAIQARMMKKEQLAKEFQAKQSAEDKLKAEGRPLPDETLEIPRPKDGAVVDDEET